MAETANREDWKSKYRDLLTEIEQKEGNWQALDSALRGVASRLAIAAMGRDESVDKHLATILDAIKERLPEERLTDELDGLSAAVLRHEKHIAANDAVDLSRFVADLQLAPAAQKRFIDALESDTATMRMQALNDLASELNTLLQAAATTSPDHDASESVQKILNTLVRHMDDVPEMAVAVDELKQQLHNGMSQDALNNLVENLAIAVGGVIASIGEDKRELEAFLEQVTQQLAQFEDWARGNESESLERRKDTDSLERNVEQQVGDLQSDMDASTDMSELKQRVQTRLDSIADQLTNFRKNEEQRAAAAGKRNAVLLEEINRLKVRTSELAKRCSDQEDRLMHDALTGAHTRYAYDQRLQEEFQRWQRHGQPLSYSIWDLDYFKKVNDNFGHQTGDRLLAVVAGMLSESTRVEDFVARIGGEEFVVLFPSTSLETAQILAERLREKIAAVSFHLKGTPIPATVSCGITEFRTGDTPESVYKRADQALYQAKADGRNRCVTA